MKGASHLNFSPVLVPLPGGRVVHLSKLMGVEADELGLDLLQQGLYLPLLPLLDAAVRVRVQAVEVRLSGTCEGDPREAAVRTVSRKDGQTKSLWTVGRLAGRRRVRTGPGTSMLVKPSPCPTPRTSSKGQKCSPHTEP